MRFQPATRVLACLAGAVVLAANVAFAQPWADDQQLLEWHLDEIRRDIAAVGSVAAGPAEPGDVHWLRVVHSGGRVFDTEVAPHLDRVLAAASPDPTKRNGKKFVVLIEIGVLRETPSREDLDCGRYAQLDAVTTQACAERTNRILQAGGQMPPHPDPWYDSLGHWLGRNAPEVAYDRRSAKGSWLWGMHRLLDQQANEARTIDDYSTKVLLETAFQFAAVMQRDLDLRQQIRFLLHERPGLTIAVAYGAAHDPGLVLAGLSAPAPVSVEGWENSDLARSALGLREALLEWGVEGLTKEAVLEYRVRSESLAAAIATGLGCKQAFRASTESCAQDLRRLGTWQAIAAERRPGGRR